MGVSPVIIAIIGLGIIALVMSGALQANWSGVLRTVREPVWLLRAVLAVNVIVPLSALAVCLLLPLDPLVKLAIMIMAISPLAPPISQKLVGSAADASRIEGHFVLATLLSVLIVPLTFALFSDWLATPLTVTTVDVAGIAVLLVVVPVAIGLTLGTVAPAFAVRAAPWIAKIAMVTIGLACVPLLLVHLPIMAGLVGDGTLLAMIAISVAAVAAGHWIGGPDPRNRLLLATAAVVRHPGIALMIIASNEIDDRAVTAVLLFLLINILVSVAYQRWLSTRYKAALAAVPN